MLNPSLHIPKLLRGDFQSMCASLVYEATLKDFLWRFVTDYLNHHQTNSCCILFMPNSAGDRLSPHGLT